MEVIEVDRVYGVFEVNAVVEVDEGFDVSDRCSLPKPPYLNRRSNIKRHQIFAYHKRPFVSLARRENDIACLGGRGHDVRIDRKLWMHRRENTPRIFR